MRHWTVAITGVHHANAVPCSASAIARCLRSSPGFGGRLVGLSQEDLVPGLHAALFDCGYQIPQVEGGEWALLDRLLELDEVQEFDALIPGCPEEIPLLQRIAPELARSGIRTLLPSAGALAISSDRRLFTFCRRLGLEVDSAEGAWEPTALAGVGDGRGRLARARVLRSGTPVFDARLRAAAARFTAATKWAGPLEMRAERGPGEHLRVVGVQPCFPCWISGSAADLPEVLLALMAGGCERWDLSSPRNGKTQDAIRLRRGEGAFRANSLQCSSA